MYKRQILEGITFAELRAALAQSAELRHDTASWSEVQILKALGARFAGRLHKRDLLADTPYNTYTRAGLPPTPIALPGRAAIDAALDPEPSQVLYFVARGDGSSEFSLSLAEHNRAVDRYQRGVHPAAAPRSWLCRRRCGP